MHTVHVILSLSRQRGRIRGNEGGNNEGRAALRIACCKVAVKRNPSAVTHFLAQIGFPNCAPLLPPSPYSRSSLHTSRHLHFISHAGSIVAVIIEGAGGEVRTA